MSLIIISDNSIVHSSCHRMRHTLQVLGLFEFLLHFYGLQLIRMSILTSDNNNTLSYTLLCCSQQTFSFWDRCL